jgi:tRNA threonylcarbamoyladenosine biosynthesis protein TsaE
LKVKKLHSANLQIITCSTEETKELGKTVGRVLFPGAIILLSGELGTGKTVFACGVASGLGVATPVTSPSFTLLNAHQGRLAFYHFDLYRLDSEQDLLEIGLDELLTADGVCLVEWADRFPDFFTEPALRVKITAEGPDRRRFYFAAGGDDYAAIMAELETGG